MHSYVCVLSCINNTNECEKPTATAALVQKRSCNINTIDVGCKKFIENRMPINFMNAFNFTA